MPIEPPLDVERAVALGARLVRLRIEHGLSQEHVAHAAGISRNHYQLLEKGLSNRKERTPANPRLSTLVRLCEVFETSVPELMTDVFGPVPGVEIRYEPPEDHGSPARGSSPRPGTR